MQTFEHQVCARHCSRYFRSTLGCDPDSREPALAEFTFYWERASLSISGVLRAIRKTVTTKGKNGRCHLALGRKGGIWGETRSWQMEWGSEPREPLGSRVAGRRAARTWCWGREGSPAAQGKHWVSSTGNRADSGDRKCQDVCSATGSTWSSPCRGVGRSVSLTLRNGAHVIHPAASAACMFPPQVTARRVSAINTIFWESPHSHNFYYCLFL